MSYLLHADQKPCHARLCRTFMGVMDIDPLRLLEDGIRSQIGARIARTATSALSFQQRCAVGMDSSVRFKSVYCRFEWNHESACLSVMPCNQRTAVLTQYAEADRLLMSDYCAGRHHWALGTARQATARARRSCGF